eukprot:scaffold6899_cov183-Amphora_coffeaeformis.AAC.39
MEAAGNLIVAMIAHGVDHNRDWPFVTLSSFQERATTAKDLSGSLMMSFMPVVTHSNRLQWENYTLNDPDNKWYHDAIDYQEQVGLHDLDNAPPIRTDDPNLDLTSGIANYIYNFDKKTLGKATISPQAETYLPIWQSSPVTQQSLVNQNSASNSLGAQECLRYSEVVFDGMRSSKPGYGSDDNPVTSEIAWLLRMADRDPTKRYEGDIFTMVYFPVYSSFVSTTRETVGIMRAVIHWSRYFVDILPEATQGIVLVLEDGCSEPYTYQIDGGSVTPFGHGDLHDTKYDEYMKYATFADVKTISDGTEEGMKLHFDQCTFSIRVYPSDRTVETTTTNTPIVITVSVAIVFLFTVMMFFAYDRLVERRQRILMEKAKRTHRIVASLFPKNIRDQILDDDGDLRQGGLLGAKKNLKSFVDTGYDHHQIFGQMPIADLYPEATIMFADISGFTSWSSSREPAQVFVLLQTLYQAFDEIAKKRKVFKVETIGDSGGSTKLFLTSTYIGKMYNRNPVGARYRPSYSRLASWRPVSFPAVWRHCEHCGSYGIVDRAYSANTANTDDDEDILTVDFAGKLADELLRREREVEWVSELLRDSIRDIVAARATKKGKIMKSLDSLPSHRSKSRTPLDEVVDVIKMPEFDAKSASREAEVFSVKIPENVSRLIREYVSIIAAAYRKNPFHNFEHACHVVMCTK